MTDNTELLRKLTALSTPASILEDGKRVISNGTWPNPLSAMLCEIDDTVLKRKLTFANGSNELSVVAAGRRLLALVEVSKQMNISQEILGQPLSNTEIDLVNSVAEVMATFAQHDGRLVVNSEATKLLDGQTEGGVPVSMLADIMDIDLDEESGGPLQHFIEGSQDQMTSCIFYFNGEEVGETGDDTEIAKVRSIIGQDWDAFRKNLPFLQQGQSGPFLICLASALGDSVSLFVAEAGKTFTAFTSSDDDAPAIQESWGNYFVI